MEFILITNSIRNAIVAEKAGINRIMVDLEILGKIERQGHLNTLISKHDINDINHIRKVISKSELMVRINPINRNSRDEINQVLDCGVDVIMLPMFKNVAEVEEFLEIIDGRCKTNLLFETSQSFVRCSQIMKLEGITEVHIGLNDLHLSFGLNFMFELISEGIVDFLCSNFRKSNIDFGIGGIARIGKGLIKSEDILLQHIKLGSKRAILSRDFSVLFNNLDDDSLLIQLTKEIKLLKDKIRELSELNPEQFHLINERFINSVRTLANNMKS